MIWKKWKNISHKEIPCGIVLTVFLELYKRILHIMSTVILFFVSVYSFRNIKILVIKQRIITTAIFEIMKTKKKKTKRMKQRTNSRKLSANGFVSAENSIPFHVLISSKCGLFKKIFCFIVTFTNVYEVLRLFFFCGKCSFRMRASFPLLLHIIIKCLEKKVQYKQYHIL